ncbi:MAG: iron-containing alcohol dehydrogenase [Deltaproteobacteria bacterium]|nr:iron-containing alcohol dehydrogenase [Deltaproteobacteria bacterium]
MLPSSTAASWSAELGSAQVLFGEGRLDDLGELARDHGATVALVVTDPGLRQAGHPRRALASLEKAGITGVLFDGAEENPTTVHVEAGVEVARQAGIDFLIGLGGGSAMDCAKGINFLLTNGGRMEDYWGVGKASKPMLPSIGIPTTAGTGSEAQSFALISQPESHRKMACGDKKARFRALILDPELLVTAPRRVMALSGFDAISHAVESYVTAKRNPLSQLYAREAWRLLSSSFEGLLLSPQDPKPRRRMLLGATLAGASIELSMLGAAHSCANPLTARFGVAHGGAVGLMLPAVVRFNGSAVNGLYGELLATQGWASNGQGHGAALGARLEELRSVAGLPQRLSEVGVRSEALPALAAEAAEQWTAQFNPRAVAAEDLEGLYREVLK